MHKLSDASFTVKDQDGKDKAIKGGLYLDTDHTADTASAGGSTLGNVVFVTNEDTAAAK
jgi:hypothetical protein